MQPNIIPDTGQIWWFIRDANGPWAKENFDKLVDIARGAALMTGTTMEMEPFGAAWPSLGNKAIAEAIQKNIEASECQSGPKRKTNSPRSCKNPWGERRKACRLTVSPLVAAARQNSSSNDIGDITWVVPTATVRFPVVVPGVQAHHWTAGITPTMSIAHKGAVDWREGPCGVGSRLVHVV